MDRIVEHDRDEHLRRNHAGAQIEPRLLNDLDDWETQVTDSLESLAAYLGPVPFRDLWVTVVPGASEGIESSGSVQLGGGGRHIEAWLVTHELAHQWTYALVGNNQALHPWLDESVTSMIQAVVDDPDHGPGTSDHRSDDAANSVGRPMSFFASSRRPGEAYNEAIYAAGADVQDGVRRTPDAPTPRLKGPIP